MMIKPVLLHQANGGYIIFQAKDILNNGACYDALKKALKIKELSIENAMEQRNGMLLVSLKPEPIPLKIKVLLIGSSNIYHTLLSMDDDFRKLFKIKVEFEEDAPKTTENIERLSKFVRSFCAQEGLLDLDKEAMARIVETTSKLAGDKEKLSTQFSEIGQIIGEASVWARKDKQKVISKEYIQKALDEFEKAEITDKMDGGVGSYLPDASDSSTTNEGTDGLKTDVKILFKTVKKVVSREGAI